jgi:hypothetical protein
MRGKVAMGSAYKAQTIFCDSACVSAFLKDREDFPALAGRVGGSLGKGVAFYQAVVGSEAPGFF